MKEINRVASQTSFNGVKVLSTAQTLNIRWRERFRNYRHFPEEN